MALRSHMVELDAWRNFKPVAPDIEITVFSGVEIEIPLISVPIYPGVTGDDIIYGPVLDEFGEVVMEPLLDPDTGEPVLDGQGEPVMSAKLDIPDPKEPISYENLLLQGARHLETSESPNEFEYQLNPQRGWRLTFNDPIPPSNGKVGRTTFNDGFTYKSDNGFVGEDCFNYVLSNQTQMSDYGKIVLTVERYYDIDFHIEEECLVEGSYAFDTSLFIPEGYAAPLLYTLEWHLVRPYVSYNPETRREEYQEVDNMVSSTIVTQNEYTGSTTIVEAATYLPFQKYPDDSAIEAYDPSTDKAYVPTGNKARVYVVLRVYLDTKNLVVQEGVDGEPDEVVEVTDLDTFYEVEVDVSRQYGEKWWQSGNVKRPILGCTDPAAANYNALADCDNGSCKYGIIENISVQSGSSLYSGGVLTIKVLAVLSDGAGSALLDASQITYTAELQSGDQAQYDVTSTDIIATGDPSTTYQLGFVGTLDSDVIVRFTASIANPAFDPDYVQDLEDPESLPPEPEFLTGYKDITYRSGMPVEAEPVIGCTNELAYNYDPLAEVDDGSCILPASEPHFTIEDVKVVETNLDYVATFKIVSDIEVVGIAHVNWQSIEGTATEEDFELTDGSVTFKQGEKERTISINIKGDVIEEGDETFNIRLTTDVGTVGPDAVVTIDDDEGPQPVFYNYTRFRHRKIHIVYDNKPELSSTTIISPSGSKTGIEAIDSLKEDLLLSVHESETTLNVTLDSLASYVKDFVIPIYENVGTDNKDVFVVVFVNLLDYSFTAGLWDSLSTYSGVPLNIKLNIVNLADPTSDQTRLEDIVVWLQDLNQTTPYQCNISADIASHTSYGTLDLGPYAVVTDDLLGIAYNFLLRNYDERGVECDDDPGTKFNDFAYSEEHALLKAERLGFMCGV